MRKQALIEQQKQLINKASELIRGVSAGLIRWENTNENLIRVPNNNVACILKELPDRSDHCG